MDIDLRLQLIDTGDFLVLSDEDGSDTLTVDINSTLFNQQDELLGSIGYPFSFPLEDNQAFINNNHIVNTDPALRSPRVMIWLGNIPFKESVMYYTIDTGRIVATFYIDTAIIANILKTTTLNALPGVDDDQVSMHSAAELKAYMMAAAAAAPGVYPMTFFPFKNDGAYNDDAYVGFTRYSALVVYPEGSKIRYTNNRIYEVTTTTTAGMNPVANADHFNDITVYADIDLPVSTIFNRWELDLDGNGSFTVNPDGGPYDQTIMPFFYLVYILKRVAGSLGYTVQGSWPDEDNAKRIVMFTNVPVFGTNIESSYLMMPAINVGDFIKAVRTEFGLLIDFDQVRSVMTIESLENITTKADVVDLQPYQTITQRDTLTQTNAWILKRTAEGSDKAWDGINPDDMPQRTIGDPRTAINVTEIQMPSVATKMITEPTPIDKAYVSPDVPIFTNQRMPHIKMPVFGNTPLDQVSSAPYADRNNFALRFLYYHGMKLDDGGYAYPYGSSDNKDFYGNPLVDYTLDISDQTGAFIPVIFYFTFMLSTKPQEVVFLLIPADVLKIKPYSKIIFRDYNQSAVHGVLDQLSADFTIGEQRVPAKLSIYPLIRIDNEAEVPSEGVVIPPEPPDNGTVYLRMVGRNALTDTEEFPPPTHTTHSHDRVLQFYEDAAATVPKNVTELMIRLKTVKTTNDPTYGTSVITTFGTSTVTSAAFEALLLANAPDDYNQDGGYNITWEYTVMPDARYNLL